MSNILTNDPRSGQVVSNLNHVASPTGQGSILPPSMRAMGQERNRNAAQTALSMNPSPQQTKGQQLYRNQPNAHSYSIPELPIEKRQEAMYGAQTPSNMQAREVKLF